MPQFLSTIFAIIGLVVISLCFWALTEVILVRVGKPTGLSSLRDRAASRLASTSVNPSRKSIHDRADEGSDADCYLIAVLKGAASSEIIAGGVAVKAAGSITDTHFRTSPRTGRGLL